jgi:hypothetical protein
MRSSRAPLEDTRRCNTVVWYQGTEHCVKRTGGSNGGAFAVAACKNRGMRILAAGFLAVLCACGQDRCAAVLCAPPRPGHLINITVTDARGTLLTATPAITSLVVPAGASTVGMSCSEPRPVDPRDAGTEEPTCFIDTAGRVIGHYEFDIGASGYKTQHLTADVAARPPSNDCCPLPPYVSVTLTVALSPAVTPGRALRETRPSAP